MVPAVTLRFVDETLVVLPGVTHKGVVACFIMKVRARGSPEYHMVDAADFNQQSVRLRQDS